HMTQMVECPADRLTIPYLPCQGQILLQHGLGFSDLTLQDHRFAEGRVETAHEPLISLLSTDRQRLLQPGAGRVAVAALPRDPAELTEGMSGGHAVAQLLEEWQTRRHGCLGGTDVSLHGERPAHEKEGLSFYAWVARNIRPGQDTFKRGPR